MKQVHAICPKCEGAISVDPREDAAICPKCGSAFVTEKAITAYQQKTGKADIPPSSPIEDFEIDGDVITGYKGNGGNVVIPHGIREIADKAFFLDIAERIESIYIPEGVERIGVSCFLGCDDLYEVHLPSTLTDIGEQAFGYCGIRSLTLSPNNPRYRVINGCLVDAKKKELILATHGATIPTDGSILHIGSGAFAGAHWLTGMLVIPEGVETIGHEAFLGAGYVTGITIPKSVTRISGEAFADTDMLERIVFECKSGWTYDGRPIEIPELCDYASVDDFIGRYGFKRSLIRI